MEMLSKDLEVRYGTCKIPISNGASFPDTSKSYYRPLNREKREIRLLIVEPGLDEDPLYCWLRHASLDREAPPHFDTISYCWGDSRHKGWISVNGTIMSVPISSERAIRAVRRPDERSTLWIDSICINQDNLEERSSQVAFMGQIYRTGARNRIYLGEDEGRKAEDVKLALQNFFHWYCKEYVKLSDEERRSLINWKFDNLHEDWKRKSTPSDELLQELQPLFALPWFRRLWVVQEAHLARRNVCIWGDTIFPLTDVTLVRKMYMACGGRRLPKVYSEDQSAGMLGFISSDWMMHRLRARPGLDNAPIPLEALYSQASSLKSTSEPRDYIFALLAMFQVDNNLSKIPKLLNPDYQKSVAQVFRDATRYILEEQSSEKIMIMKGRTVLERIDHQSEAEITGMASWTVKWDRIRNTLQSSDRLARTLRNTRSIQNADSTQSSPSLASKRLKIADPMDLDVLTLRGFLAAEISLRIALDSEQPLWLLDDGSAVVRLVESLRSAYTQSETYSSRCVQDRDEVIADLMTFGGKDFLGLTLGATKAESLKALMHHITSTGSLPPGLSSLLPDDVDDQRKDCGVFYWLFQLAANNRFFFSTDKGHLGLGPKFLREGDVVALFEGEDFPFVLRPFGKEYQLVGMAYIHGLSHDEVFSMGLPSIWIDIR